MILAPVAAERVQAPASRRAKSGRTGRENHPTIILGMDEIIIDMDEIILIG